VEEISAEVCLCGFVLGKIVYCVINLEIAALHLTDIFEKLGLIYLTDIFEKMGLI